MEMHGIQMRGMTGKGRLTGEEVFHLRPEGEEVNQVLAEQKQHMWEMTVLI